MSYRKERKIFEKQSAVITPKRKNRPEKINVTPCTIRLEPLTPKDLAKHNLPVTEIKQAKTVNFEAATPQANIEFSLELKKVINERNILTSKTRKRVFDALDEINHKNEEDTRTYKKENALLEIVNSEIKYVHQLEVIINFFMKPVQERKLLKADDFDILFGNITTIYNINKELLEELDKGFHNVANAFSKIGPFLKLYSVYAFEFRNSLSILQNARSVNPVFAKFVENQETRPEVQNKLSALLITPIQRVPRYKLLLKSIHEVTHPVEKDYEVLTDCLKKIEDAAEHINKIVEDQENQQRLLELQRCLRSGEPNIITVGRKLIKQGVLMKMSTKHTHSEKLFVVLMNDIIMFNKMKKDELKVNSLKCTGIFPLNKCKIIEVLDKGCLKIVCQDEELILYNDQLSKTKKWIQQIKEAIDMYVEDRKTLRKESSSRRPVKRKDINEYNEIGLSPGKPLKKRKIAVQAETPSLRDFKILARKPIHSICNSTPIKLKANPETETIPFPTLQSTQKTNVANGTERIIEKKYPDDVFVFGQGNNNHNTSRFRGFMGGVGSSIKKLLGIRN